MFYCLRTIYYILLFCEKPAAKSCIYFLHDISLSFNHINLIYLTANRFSTSHSLLCIPTDSSTEFSSALETASLTDSHPLSLIFSRMFHCIVYQLKLSRPSIYICHPGLVNLSMFCNLKMCILVPNHLHSFPVGVLNQDTTTVFLTLLLPFSFTCFWLGVTLSHNEIPGEYGIIIISII